MSGRVAVTVIARQKPLVASEVSCVRTLPGNGVEVTGKPLNATQIALGETATTSDEFHLDGVVDGTSSNAQLYADHIEPLNDVFVYDGKNTTVFCYGMTGSGKTYTLGTKVGLTAESAEERGVVQRFVAQVFEKLKKSSSYELTLQVVEIYQDKVRDLQNRRRKRLTRTCSMDMPSPDDRRAAVQVRAKDGELINTTTSSITSVAEFCTHFDAAMSTRSTASHAMNDTSSRSHAIVLLNLKVLRGDVEYTSTARFVDLAGSERMKTTGAALGSNVQREGVSINLSLSALNGYMAGLCEGGTDVRHLIRASKLTQVVQQGLGGDSLTVLITCTSSRIEDREQTVETLKWAVRARSIKNAPTSHVHALGGRSTADHSLIRSLTTKIIVDHFGKSHGPPPEDGAEATDWAHRLLETNSEVKEKFQSIVAKHHSGVLFELPTSGGSDGGGSSAEATKEAAAALAAAHEEIATLREQAAAREDRFKDQDLVVNNLQRENGIFRSAQGGAAPAEAAAQLDALCAKVQQLEGNSADIGQICRHANQGIVDRVKEGNAKADAEIELKTVELENLTRGIMRQRGALGITGGAVGIEGGVHGSEAALGLRRQHTSAKSEFVKNETIIAPKIATWISLHTEANITADALRLGNPGCSDCFPSTNAEKLAASNPNAIVGAFLANTSAAGSSSVVGDEGDAQCSLSDEAIAERTAAAAELRSLYAQRTEEAAACADRNAQFWEKMAIPDLEAYEAVVREEGGPEYSSLVLCDSDRLWLTADATSGGGDGGSVDKESTLRKEQLLAPLDFAAKTRTETIASARAALESVLEQIDPELGAPSKAAVAHADATFAPLSRALIDVLLGEMPELQRRCENLEKELLGERCEKLGENSGRMMHKMEGGVNFMSVWAGDEANPTLHVECSSGTAPLKAMIRSELAAVGGNSKKGRVASLAHGNSKHVGTPDRPRAGTRNFAAWQPHNSPAAAERLQGVEMRGRLAYEPAEGTSALHVLVAAIGELRREIGALDLAAAQRLEVVSNYAAIKSIHVEATKFEDEIGCGPGATEAARAKRSALVKSRKGADGKTLKAQEEQRGKYVKQRKQLCNKTNALLRSLEGRSVASAGGSENVAP